MPRTALEEVCDKGPKCPSMDRPHTAAGLSPPSRLACLQERDGTGAMDTNVNTGLAGSRVLGVGGALGRGCRPPTCPRSR